MKSVPQQGRRVARPPPPPVEEDDDEFTDEEYDEEEYSDGAEEEDDGDDIGDLMVDLLSHEEDNVCSAMLKVAKQLETTNRLLVKMLASSAPAQEAPAPKPRRTRRPQQVASSEEEGPVDLTEDDGSEEQTEA